MMLILMRLSVLSLLVLIQLTYFSQIAFSKSTLCEKVILNPDPSCQKIKIFLNFQQCPEFQTSVPLPMKVHCKPSHATASLVYQDHHYTIALSAQTNDNPWAASTSSWLIAGPLHKEKIQSPGASVDTPPAAVLVVTTPTTSALPSAPVVTIPMTLPVVAPASVTPLQQNAPTNSVFQKEHPEKITTPATPVNFSNADLPATLPMTLPWTSTPRMPPPVPISSDAIGREPASIHPNTSIAPLASPPSSTPTAEVLTKINGFIDTQFHYNSFNPLRRGFVIQDGALYFTQAIQDLDMKIDIPFRMVQQGDTHFEIAYTKAQAFLGQKLSSGFRWKAGQFDTTFGFEGNDTTDIAFTRQGGVYYFTDPCVHTGVQLGYDFTSEMGLNFYMTNPNDRGTLSGNGIQYGLQLVKNSTQFRFAPGFLINSNAAQQKTNIYLDLVTGLTFGALSIDAEMNYNYRADLTNPDTQQPIQGIGLLIHTLYTVDDKLSFGWRGEYISQQAVPDPMGNLSLQNPLKSQLLLFVGPQYYITKNIRLKLDYAYQHNTPFSNGRTQETHGVQAAAVLRF